MCALVDMARITDEQHRDISRRFAGRLHPLIIEPGLEALTPLSATLIEAPSTDWEGQHHLVSELNGYNSDVIDVLITSVLPISELAAHLRQTTFAYDEASPQESPVHTLPVQKPKERRYLIRYYDPLITPVLYGDAPDDWQQWFFAPLMSWCFALPDTRQEQWHQLVGGRTRQIPPAPRLMLTDTLKQALEHDPLPYTILEFLEKQGTARFDHSCRGVRLAQVKKALAQAREQGFTDKGHLGEYVWLSFHDTMPRILAHPHWGAIKQQAIRNNGRLIALVEHTIGSSKEISRGT